MKSRRGILAICLILGFLEPSYSAEAEASVACDCQAGDKSIESLREVMEQVQDQAAQSKYAHVDPNKVVPADLLAKALRRYESDRNNSEYLAIADMAKHSREDRFFLIHMKSGKVESFKVSHGRGSDPDGDGWADRFSNQNESNSTSLGFYLTAETYIGKHGKSLRLDGLNKSNSLARERAIVVHGAGYVTDNHTGRSLGCPAFSNQDAPYIINRIKNGTLLYLGRSEMALRERAIASR